MAMTIRLQDEFGNAIDEVHDRTGIIEMLLPSNKNESYYCLRFVDPYGDTYFNRSQMEQFLVEWDRVFEGKINTETKGLFDRVKVFAEQCAKEPHLYIKFVGD